MPVFNIPKATLRPGRRPLGPYSVAAGMYSFALDVTCSQPAAPNNAFGFALQGSVDGGATWETLGGIPPIVGGFAYPFTYTDDVGTVTIPTLHWETAFWLGTPDAPSPDRGRNRAMLVQLAFTILGDNVAVAGGTLTVD